LALSFAALGCGSDGAKIGAEATTCGVAPCGGEIVGAWQPSSACVDRETLKMDFLNGVMDSCPTASLGAITMTPNGAVSFADDATFTGTLTVSSTVEVNFPRACIGAAPCDLVTMALQTLVGTSGVTSITCATGAAACVCTFAQTMDQVDDSGTWATSGTAVALAGATLQQSIPYCVEGSSLHLLELDMGSSTMVISDVVLTRQ